MTDGWKKPHEQLPCEGEEVLIMDGNCYQTLRKTIYSEGDGDFDELENPFWIEFPVIKNEKPIEKTQIKELLKFVLSKL